MTEQLGVLFTPANCAHNLNEMLACWMMLHQDFKEQVDMQQLKLDTNRLSLRGLQRRSL